MRTRIAQALVTMIALVTFMFVGASMVWDFHNWECECTHIECRWCEDEFTWVDFNEAAYEDYADEFTALFNSYETKWSKNNRLMIRSGNSGSYRFVAKA